MVGLQITDGTTTVDLNDGSYWEIEELDIGVGDVSAQTVSGSVRLYMDSTKANMQAEIAALQKLLQQAVEYSGSSLGAPLYSSLDNPVYLNYRTDGTEAYYRSQIYKAAWSMPPESIKTLNDDCGGIEYIVDFERWNWWEGAEAQLGLTNPTASDTTNAINVYNPYYSIIATTIAFVQATSKITDSANGLAGFKTGDVLWVRGSTSNNGRFTIATGGVAGEIVVNEALVNEGAGDTVTLYGQLCSYVEIDGADVGGDLPARVRLEMTNNYAGSAYDTAKIWIGQNFTNPTTFSPILESGASPDYGNPVTAVNNATTKLAEWTLSDATLSAAAGRYFKFVAAFPVYTLHTTIRYLLRLELTGGNVIWQSSWTKFDSSIAYAIRDMFTFQLPPMLSGLTSLQELNIVLYIYQNTGINLNYRIDWAQLLPVDGFYLNNILFGLNLNERAVNDGFAKQDYVDDGSGLDKLPRVTAEGQPITLQPGRTQRLYFITHSDIADAYYDSWSTAVKVYYRPRRLSI